MTIYLQLCMEWMRKLFPVSLPEKSDCESGLRVVVYGRSRCQETSLAPFLTTSCNFSCASAHFVC